MPLSETDKAALPRVRNWLASIGKSIDKVEDFSVDFDVAIKPQTGVIKYRMYEHTGRCHVTVYFTDGSQETRNFSNQEVLGTSDTK